MIVLALAFSLQGKNEVAVGRPVFVQPLGVVVALPLVEEELAERTGDIVAEVGRSRVVVETSTSEILWGWLLALFLPLDGPVDEGSNTVVIVGVMLGVDGCLGQFQR